MKISFIVCTYSKELFSDTMKCIDSIIDQNYTDKEILLVMDKNDILYDMYLNSLPKSVNMLVNTNPGLSNARNLGVKNASGDIIVFIDDDAFADKNYITNLIKNYEDENVVGVAGKILPQSKPNYPEELYWIGGFTYKGYPEDRREVRNGHGCNMSFRREIFDRVGLFNTTLGRIGKNLITDEETEFSIRILNSCPNLKIIYDPSIIVYHKVYDYRQTFKYIMKRAYREGTSKALVEKLHKNKNGNKALSTEDTYLKYLFSRAIHSRIENMIIGGDVIGNTKDIISLLAVIASVGFGYTIEKIK